MSDLSLGALRDIGQVLAGLKEGKAKEYTVIAILGGKDSGKSGLVRTFITGTWEPTASTQSFIEMKSRSIDVKGRRIEVVVCEYAGSKEFRMVQRTMFPPTKAVPVKCLLTVDLSRKDSRNELVEVIENLVVPRLSSKNPPESYLLVGCKADLKRNISPAEINDFSNTLSAKLKRTVQYIETSAKDRRNVMQAFELLISKEK